MLKDRLAESPSVRTNLCVCIQGNKGRPVCCAVMDKGRIVDELEK